MSLIPPSPEFAWPTMPIDIELLLRVHDNAEAPGNQYGLGAKVPLDTDSTDMPGLAVDCSGYVRWLIYKATKGTVVMPDGSWIQHEWIRDRGFKKSSVDAANLRDGAVRIAFLSPQDGGGIGHVALILNDSTLESHGGTGPDSRPWTGERWQARCSVYVLTRPTRSEA
jgi:hypothetical protein